jgi:outer membrane protein assembly factor BamB
VVWRSAPGTVSYATPISISAAGREQIVYSSEDSIVGIDAGTGEYLWSHRSFNTNRDNISNPIWGSDGLLWSSTQPDGGSRVIRLERAGERIQPRELWSSNRIHIHYWNAVRIDNHIYASIGGQGLVFACIDVRNGNIEWRRRGFEKANLLHTGDKTLLLDATGTLALVRLTPEKMTVLARVDIAAGETWTVPTLVGTTLYLRDHARIRAFDLGRFETGRNEPL